jgi:hypothetical protein
MKQKAGFLGKKQTNKKTRMTKSLPYLTKMSWEKTQVSKIRNEKWEIITINKEIQEIIRDYFEYIYSDNLENLEEVN